MAIPNTNTFCLSDVRTEIQANKSATYSANTTLSETFILAANISFDNAYEGSQDRLSNYRNYVLITGWTGTGGAGRTDIAFDGVNMWTADFSNNSVTKITSGVL